MALTINIMHEHDPSASSVKAQEDQGKAVTILTVYTATKNVLCAVYGLRQSMVLAVDIMRGCGLSNKIYPQF